MLEDLCRAILTKYNKKYEFISFDADLPDEAQYQRLEDNHIFDFCVKEKTAGVETAAFRKVELVKNSRLIIANILMICKNMPGVWRPPSIFLERSWQVTIN